MKKAARRSTPAASRNTPCRSFGRPRGGFFSLRHDLSSSSIGCSYGEPKSRCRIAHKRRENMRLDQELALEASVKPFAALSRVARATTCRQIVRIVAPPLHARHDMVG
jgi:hypothetical protein